MPDLEIIRKEIIEEISNRLKGDPRLPKAVSKANEELDVMSNTNGLEQKNNLETFYSIWKKNQGKVGHKNEINSWTAFFLGMTETKPEKGSEFVPIRRCFARAGFPDIDTDFDDEKRDSVYDYIIAKYGRENVGNIGTHGKLKFKSCVTRVVKALDVAGSFLKSPEAYISDNAQKVTEILEPFPKKGLMKVTDEDGNEHLIKNFKDAYRYCPDFAKSIDKHPEIKIHAEHIEGTFANFGCLAANTPILTEKGWIRIDQLTTKYKIAYVDKDEKIKYTDEFKKFKTGIKKTYRMRLSSGSFIDVTDEHLIFTDKGCVKFEEIRKNQKKYKIYEVKEYIKERRAKLCDILDN